MIKFKGLSFLSLPVALAMACSTAVPPSLVDARAAYQRAAQGPAAQLTPAQLHAAETSLSVAEQTFKDEGASENARDRAYVAQRKAEIAEVQASIALADQNTAIAAERVETAKAETQKETDRNLTTAKAELAGEKTLVATQKAEIESEKQLRLEAERRAAEALVALAEIASVKKEARGTVITLSGAVIFASGKSELLPGARAKLDQVAVALSQGDPESKISVEGHTDSQGSDAMNQDLSARRAEAVRSYLVSKGLAPASVVSQGFGKSTPIADNETPEGRANNRRVEIVVQPG